jgi:hypothetical protein
MTSAEKIATAPITAAAARPSNVSAVLMFIVTLASLLSMDAVRSARCRARE